MRETEAAVRERRLDGRSAAANSTRARGGGEGRHATEDVRRCRGPAIVERWDVVFAVEEALIQRRGLVKARARGSREAQLLECHAVAEGAIGVAGGGGDGLGGM
jgi:hypothetical protein